MTQRAFDAPLARAWLAAMADAVTRQRAELTDLDAAIGDGDHGANLSRGFTAVTAALAAQAEKPADTDVSAGQVLTTAGSTLISKVGGASGPLYGSALRAIGRALGSADSSGPDAANLLAALRAGLDAIARLGGAKPGDKTILDAYVPAVDAFEAAIEAGAELSAAALAAAEAAGQGATATITLVARKGRASYLGERSAGHQDPGATSTALLFRALADVTGAVSAEG
jgi:phosphoenolpyruvate---glycerone phosphotransferase subunit DhaL